jgi:glycerophosphoryl diester phosphodiesterase
MDNYTAVGIAEGFIECDDESTIIEAWQYLHDTRKKRLRLPPLKDGETHYVIAHRGGSMENPENTLQAFKHAVKKEFY